jgi:hypothetical protein
LGAAGHDVNAIIETSPGVTDRVVLDLALTERRVLLAPAGARLTRLPAG